MAQKHADAGFAGEALRWVPAMPAHAAQRAAKGLGEVKVGSGRGSALKRLLWRPQRPRRGFEASRAPSCDLLVLAALGATARLTTALWHRPAGYGFAIGAAGEAVSHTLTLLAVPVVLAATAGDVRDGHLAGLIDLAGELTVGGVGPA